MNATQLGLGYLAAALILLLVNAAQAHPLGNNTVNRAADIQVHHDRIAIRFLLDLAEIPTLLAGQDADGDGDGETSDMEWDAYTRARGRAVLDDLLLTRDTVPLALILRDSRWQRVPGAAGLDTLRLEFRLSAAGPGRGTAAIEYRDTHRREEAGWKEVVVRTGPGVSLVRSDAPSTSPSRWLTKYPDAEGAWSGRAPDRVAASMAVEIGMGPLRAEGSPEGTIPPPDRTSSRPVSPPHTSEVPPEPVRATAPPSVMPGNAAVVSNSVDSRHWGAFFRLGAHHIATGWDHLIFLLGLVVAQHTWRRLAWVVSAFTLAHSLTLALAAGGAVSPPGAWVEPAIAVTIAYVGLANLTGRLAHGTAVAFGFGLVHGLGFAGTLAAHPALETGAGWGWLGSLAAFNLGIEAFQLGLILLLWPLWHVVRRLEWTGPTRRVTSLGVLGFGLGWLYLRA